MNLSPCQVGVLLLSLVVALAVLLQWLPPLAQPLEYHRFADGRGWLGVPNFLNVMSNMAFLLVAALVLRVLAGTAGTGAERLPYGVLFIALAATGIGSAYYHLAPDNHSLFWDRLPMSAAFAALVAAQVGERWSPRAGIWSLAVLVAAGVGTVLWWRYSAVIGRENILPYVGFQGGALLAVSILLLLPARYSHGACLLAGIFLYAIALGAELFDHIIFSWGQGVSGHTVKHVLAALAVYQVVRMLRLRRRV